MRRRRRSSCRFPALTTSPIPTFSATRTPPESCPERRRSVLPTSIPLRGLRKSRSPDLSNTSAASFRDAITFLGTNPNRLTPRREESVAWILKVHAYFGFQPLTAYLSVNYMDRFLDSRQLPQANGWPLQLLSVACLSLAAKMEEPLVPPLVDLQVEGAKYIFEPKTIRRMELLVLGALDWRLRSVTPFNFLSFFASKLNSTGTFTGFLISRATEIILSNIQEASFLAYWPSCIAAASILCAANEIPNWSLVRPEHAESWCGGLRKEKIIGCYQFMREFVISNSQTKPPKMFPQLRVTTRLTTKSNDDDHKGHSQ
ncbi:hypothetical protein K1719_017525 [Acacia pycnantha]|nr:hypothetical protein K1719_017525 [Acacia pycnantha]